MSVVRLVQLKKSGQWPPIFLAHGIAGDATDFSELVKHIRLPHPIYAMQATSNDDSAKKPLRSIEEMAGVYLDAIKAVQPEGPYLLVGYSLGGLVSLEVAQRLYQARDRVPLLTLVDSYPHPSRLPARQRCGLLRRAINRRASGAIGRITNHGRNCSSSQSSRLASAHTESSRPLRHPQKDSYLALRRYRPRFYEGGIRFIKAEIATKFPDDPAAVWARLASEFESETMPGDHVTMLSVYSKILASRLTRHITNALLNNPRWQNEQK